MLGIHEYPNSMSKYEELVNKYDFSSLRFPLSLSPIDSFAKANVEKVIYPLRVSQTVVPDM